MQLIVSASFSRGRCALTSLPAPGAQSLYFFGAVRHLLIGPDSLLIPLVGEFVETPPASWFFHNSPLLSARAASGARTLITPVRVTEVVRNLQGSGISQFPPPTDGGLAIAT